MTDETSFMWGRMLPMDVEGGPVEFAEVEIEAEATGGRPCVLVEQDGTLALLVDGTAGPALVGCSPAWLRELARTIARPRTRWSEGPGTLEPADGLGRLAVAGLVVARVETVLRRRAPRVVL